MRTHWMVAMVAAVAAAATGAREARADACLDAVQAPTADRALMEPCLKSRPTVFGSIGGGVTLPGGWGAFATVDAPLPMALSGSHARISTIRMNSGIPVRIWRPKYHQCGRRSSAISSFRLSSFVGYGMTAA